MNRVSFVMTKYHRQAIEPLLNFLKKKYKMFDIDEWLVLENMLQRVEMCPVLRVKKNPSLALTIIW